MSRVLAFSAMSVGAEDDDEVCGLDFEGPQGFAFAVLNEDGARFRTWWHDGNSGQDECILRFSEVLVSVGRFRAVIDRAGSQRYSGPYDQVDITFEDHEADETSAVLAVVRQLFTQQKQVVRVDIRGLPEHLL